MGEVEIVSGQRRFEGMTAQLLQENEGQYVQLKILNWANMVTERRVAPTKWLKPDRQGTRVNFVGLHSTEEIHKALSELSGFIAEAKMAGHWPDLTELLEATRKARTE